MKPISFLTVILLVTLLTKEFSLLLPNLFQQLANCQGLRIIWLCNLIAIEVCLLRFGLWQSLLIDVHCQVYSAFHL